jgi:antitoxin component of MazEF toxin-antitoxin module
MKKHAKSLIGWGMFFLNKREFNMNIQNTPLNSAQKMRTARYELIRQASSLRRGFDGHGRASGLIKLKWSNTNMHKKLVKYGNSNALIIDRAILELLNIKEGAMLHLKTDGTSLIITPVQTEIDTNTTSEKTIKNTTE